MAKIETLRPRDVSRFLRAVPQLVNLPKKPMWIDYDEEVDVLVSANRSEPRIATCATTALSSIGGIKKLLA